MSEAQEVRFWAILIVASQALVKELGTPSAAQEIRRIEKPDGSLQRRLPVSILPLALLGDLALKGGASMASYFNDETSFVRAFGNRTLVLVLLCMLARSGDKPGSTSFLNVPFNITQGDIVMFGPVFALIVLASLKMEATGLRLSRATILNDPANKTLLPKPSLWTVALFFVPTLAAAFLTLQSVTKLVPNPPGCEGFDWRQQFVGPQIGTASMWCFKNLTDGMPWIYPPAQTYAAIACVLACGVLSFMIARGWREARHG